jgi:hypothetical protein
MTKTINRALPISILFLLLFLFIGPLASSTGNGVKISSAVIEDSSNKVEEVAAVSVYETLNLGAKGLSRDAFDYAIKGFEKLKAKGKLDKANILTIIDFSLPSNKKRLFVIDVNSGKLLFNSYVAHGQNSGKAMAESFSNVNESLQSSIGFFITSGTYTGKNGFSMYLNGMEKGFNDNAYSRSIVMHGADYATAGFVQARGFLGRSWGCPAVPPELNKPIIDKIKGGSCLFIYSNKKSYLSQSTYINS